MTVYTVWKAFTQGTIVISLMYEPPLYSISVCKYDCLYLTNFFSDRDRKKSTGDDKRAGRPTIISDTLVTSVDSCK